MAIVTYDRQAAVEYAHRWAYGRNPKYLDFSDLGGDCTSYASQCMLAGSHGVMNYTPTFGWYYRTANDRAPAWTGVEYLYNFLTANKGDGPFGSETSITRLEPGDIVQLQVEGDRYHHSPVVVAIRRSRFPSLRDILVAAHSYDADYRPLSSYMARRIRFLHIEGVRTGSGDTATPAEESETTEAPAEEHESPAISTRPGGTGGRRSTPNRRRF